MSLDAAPPGGSGRSSRLVLVGGGHAHVQILRRWTQRPIPNVRLSVVLDRPGAVYSGMVPGFVAGAYSHDEISIDVARLARRAGATLILGAATSVEASMRRIFIEGQASIEYDVASLDVGSSVRGLDLPGVREHALATRPIGEFVSQLDERLAIASRDRRTVRIAVVGAGAAGVELAFTLHARLQAAGIDPDVTLLTASARVLPGYPARMARRLADEAGRRAIRIRGGVRVVAVERDAVVLADERVACDLVVWATGAAAPPLATASALPKTADGFIRVGSSLQVLGRDDLFAAGDCATIEEVPWVPKAGVYAVRAGPILDANLRARLLGRQMRDYRPQRDFLMLLNLGERYAVGSKWRLVVDGAWVWRLKDRIDRRFVETFRV